MSFSICPFLYPSVIHDVIYLSICRYETACLGMRCICWPTTDAVAPLPSEHKPPSSSPNLLHLISIHRKACFLMLKKILFLHLFLTFVGFDIGTTIADIRYTGTKVWIKRSCQDQSVIQWSCSFSKSFPYIYWRNIIPTSVRVTSNIRRSFGVAVWNTSCCQSTLALFCLHTRTLWVEEVKKFPKRVSELRKVLIWWPPFPYTPHLLSNKHLAKSYSCIKKTISLKINLHLAIQTESTRSSSYAYS